MRRPWLIVSVVVVAATGSTAILLWQEKSPSPDTMEPDEALGLEAILARGLDTWSIDEDGVLVDSDGDGLPDVAENFLFGSDPTAFSTTGNGIPDGWFARHGYDPTIPGIEYTAAAVPSGDSLPDVFGGSWPPRYVLTIADVYGHGRPTDWPAQAVWENGLDPRQAWSPENDLPLSWLIHYGVDPATPPGTRLGGDMLTLAENFHYDTDPTRADTDDDGLSDAEELQRYQTDPRRESTMGTGILDGWLVLHGLDPLDPRLAMTDPAGKGMTIVETWTYNRDRFGRAEALNGTGLHPTEMSHQGNGLPDGWTIQHGFDPLAPGLAQTIIQCASDASSNITITRISDEAPDLCLTLLDYYSYGRPESWNEPASGPWKQGLDPGNPDEDGDGLPTAVELRGWSIERVLDPGPSGQPQTVRVASDPRMADTDGDGITDYEEMTGTATRNGTHYVFPPTDPTSPDTAFSGLTDLQKVTGVIDGIAYDLHETNESGALMPLLDPTRIDSAGDHLPDGIAVAAWIQMSQHAASGTPYSQLYPGSLYTTHSEWLQGMPGATGPVDAAEAARLLRPDGDVDGDGIPNVVDASASGDSLLNGWEISPDLLRFSPYTVGFPRSPTDPANPDTDGDGLPDEWELRHGRWSSAHQIWDLDPTQQDSDGNGIPDGDENLDGDVTLWHAYPSGSVTPHTWSFTNALEYEFKTNPRVKDENQDGVPEGFAIFWAHIYPSLLQQADQGNQQAATDIGDRKPSQAEIASVKPHLADPLDVSNAPPKERLDYVRFEDVTGHSDPQSLLQPGRAETFQEWAPADVQVVRNGEQQTRRLAGILGTYEHTFASDALHGLNPYLRDTDADGMTDAWETLYVQCRKPAVPDAFTDSTQDGLLDIDQVSLGTNPCVPDTDLGGIPDAQEIGDPLDPFDDLLGNGVNADTDEDGILDRDEILQGTSPTLADTDRDGLLDGETLSLVPGFSASVDARVQQFTALGIARVVTQDQQGAITQIDFLGEEDTTGGPPGTSPRFAGPRRMDSFIPGIPDGWLAYHAKTQAALVDQDGLRFQYECGRPSWWEEARHGTWWWGLLAPGPCPADRDVDGLDDQNGEDATPAARQIGEASVPWQELVIPTQSRTASEELQVAQGFGECAGHPTPCMQSWQPRWTDVLEPRIADIEWAEVGWPADAIDKGIPFTVQGRLLVPCDTNDCPAPMRTVALRIVEDATQPRTYEFDDGRILGVALTGTDGRFQVQACLCTPAGSNTVPDDVVALGKPGGNISWSPDPKIAVGTDKKLVLHAYASSAYLRGDPDLDATHPQYVSIPVDGQTRHATRAASVVSPVLELASGTNVTIDAPATLPWNADQQRVIEVRAILRDDTGTPLPQRLVRLHASDFGAIERTTDAKGVAVGNFTLPGSRTEAVLVHAAYEGEPSPTRPESFLLHPAVSATSTIPLQAPLTLGVGPVPSQVAIGSTLGINVTVEKPGNTTGIQVRATLGPLAGSALTTNGTVHVSLSIQGIELGAHALRLSVQETAAYASAVYESTVAVIGASTIQAQLPTEAHAGEHLLVGGRVVLQGGAPVADARLDAYLDEVRLLTAHADAQGRFHLELLLPGDLHPGDHALRIMFPGTPGQVEGSSMVGNLRITVPTQLDVPAVSTSRGDEAVIHGRLATERGDALPGQLVAIRLPDGQQDQQVTTSDGSFASTFRIADDQAVGKHSVTVRFNGSMDGSLAPVSSQSVLHVGAPARIVVDAPSILHRGSNTIAGRVLSADLEQPIAGLRLHMLASHGREASAASNPQGGFEFTLLVGPDEDPGPMDVRIQWPGDDSYGPFEARLDLTLRVPTRLAVHVPTETGRGTDLQVRFAVLDDRGEPIPGTALALYFLDETHSAKPSPDGSGEILLPVPQNLSLGPVQLRAAYGGTDAHDPATSTHTTRVKDGIRIEFQPLPAIRTTGQPINVRARVVDLAGAPVADQPITLWVEGQSGFLAKRTDREGYVDALFVATAPGSFQVNARFPGTPDLAAQTTKTSPLEIQSAALSSPSTWLTWAIGATVVTAAIAASVGYKLRGRRSETPDLADEIKIALQSIEAGDPWSAAVLNAYGRLSRSMRSRGLHESSSESVRDFMQALVETSHVPTTAAVELVKVFEAARYSQHAMHQQDARHARDALHRILQALDQGATV